MREITTYSINCYHGGIKKKNLSLNYKKLRILIILRMGIILTLHQMSPRILRKL
jgi:hypothetical protein